MTDTPETRTLQERLRFAACSLEGPAAIRAAMQGLDALEAENAGAVNQAYECDVCDGTGREEDAGGWPVDCHLCDGAGWFTAESQRQHDEDQP